MKAYKFHVPKRGEEAIRIEVDDLPKFYPIFHYHDELQITLIHQGEGILFAGSGFTNFNQGDIFLLGSNLPHVFKNSSGSKRACSISIYFSPDFAGHGFWNIMETRSIISVIEDSNKGIKIEGGKNTHLNNQLEKLVSLNPAKKLAGLINMMDEISQAKREHISAITYTNPPSGFHTKRMDNIISYIMKNFNQPISLEEISSRANMTSESFCRFFKLRTRKTFTDYLNEVRINNTIKLIMSGDTSVAEAAYISGFRNLSNFNRQFLKITGKRPGEIKVVNS
jgi:AraC-like DNA-binding protein